MSHDHAGHDHHAHDHGRGDDHDHHAGHGHPGRAGAPDVLRLRDVTVCYGTRPAIHHVSADLPCGSLVAVCGPNGGGKSTLLRTLLGWHRLTTGSITIGGVDHRAAAARIAYLAQRQQIDWDFPITVRAVVEMGRFAACRALRGFSAEDHAAVDAALAELGLTALAERPIAALSGGQQQRVVLARAIASGADIVLLDEPFTGLDARATADLIARLRAWAAQGRLVLAVMHDLALARAHFDRALVLATHLVACGPCAESLAAEPVTAAYGAGAAAVSGAR